MSQGNVEVVRRIFRLWTEGIENADAGALQAVYDEGLFAPDSTFTPPKEFPGASRKTYVGPVEFREFILAWTEGWAEWKIELEGVVDAGDDQVVAVVHQTAIGKSSGAPVSLRIGSVFTLRAGQVVARRDYTDPDEALEAVGLPE